MERIPPQHRAYASIYAVGLVDRAKRASMSLLRQLLSWTSVGLFVVLGTAQPALGQSVSLGVDGGVTFSDPDIEFVDAATAIDNPLPTVALGIDVAGFYMFSEQVALGVALAPAFYAAGPEPSLGINFLIGPRFVYRPAWFHLVVGGGFVVSAFDDRCDSDEPDRSNDCPLTRESAAAGLGFGLSAAPMFRLWTDDDGLDLLLGPEVRYQWARYDYEEGGGGFTLQNVQAVLSARVFVSLL
jgi:hypothetical protein